MPLPFGVSITVYWVTGVNNIEPSAPRREIVRPVSPVKIITGLPLLVIVSLVPESVPFVISIGPTEGGVVSITISLLAPKEPVVPGLGRASVAFIAVLFWMVPPFKPNEIEDT